MLAHEGKIPRVRAPRDHLGSQRDVRGDHHVPRLQLLHNPVVPALISGPETLAQLTDSMRALSITLSAEDHLDSGSVASPYRETEAMRDGSDAIADWPLLNALLNTASGATWVSIHHGGGVGIGYSIHAGQVIVADGTPEAARRLERVLTNDPGTGVMRHVDAGYDEAIACAKELGVKIPMVF